jgi:hypothetical protein
MKKEFDRYLAELQTKMVAVCMEYVENRADDIYIYASYEPEMYAFNVFYRINDKVVRKNQLNEAVESRKLSEKKPAGSVPAGFSPIIGHDQKKRRNESPVFP